MIWILAISGIMLVITLILSVIAGIKDSVGLAQTAICGAILAEILALFFITVLALTWAGVL